ncbi:hypothetical protein B0H16DRAFT_1757095 [Mycena metata]|uniref:F-box domain-containing protein n=1 Tax=Mycena metata TaxID=1033252 RepID=A0AAD7K2J3_9AGAR|nr:hypothetical protein B0H16DRAFT_1757095 [Mycena metata]
MNRALRIPELVHLICREVAAPRPDDGGFRGGLGLKQSRDLAILARTCTTTSDIALDVLWENIRTIVNLMYCLPSDLCRRDGSLRRRVRPSDSARIVLHTARARELDVRDAGFPDHIDPVALLETLDLVVPTLDLFPNLRHLTWHLDEDGAMDVLPRLLSPGIINIELGPFRSLPNLTVLATLTASCPVLTKAIIHHGSQDPPSIVSFLPLSILQLSLVFNPSTLKRLAF